MGGSHSPVGECIEKAEKELGKHLVPNEEAFGMQLGVEKDAPGEEKSKEEPTPELQIEQVKLPVIPNENPIFQTQNSFYFNKYRMKTTKELQAQQAIAGQISPKLKKVANRTPESYE